MTAGDEASRRRSTFAVFTNNPSLTRLSQDARLQDAVLKDSSGGLGWAQDWFGRPVEFGKRFSSQSLVTRLCVALVLEEGRLTSV
jgi:hypothetical protein